MEYKEFIAKNEGCYPTMWSAQSGYVATTKYPNQFGEGSWTEGVEYKVLDDEHIACQVGGSHRDNQGWEILSPEEFFALIREDAQYWLEQ
ncbi:hypothetical protein [Rhodoflexus caldus]|uniref:hypothetical protein n=1 Tax=Rhodoflexus caldus TaxID=2891236 RepID=UPI002029CFA2|nr:hypothetical protein [Rhodoflexus caldus]